MSRTSTTRKPPRFSNHPFNDPPAAAPRRGLVQLVTAAEASPETPLGDRRTAVSSTESSRYSWVVSFAGAVLLDMAALRGEGEGLELLCADDEVPGRGRAVDSGGRPPVESELSG